MSWVPVKWFLSHKWRVMILGQHAHQYRLAQVIALCYIYKASKIQIVKTLDPLPGYTCELILWFFNTPPDKAFFYQNLLIFFLFLQENIWCGYSLEAPRWGASNAYPHHMISWRNKKKIFLLSGPMLNKGVFYMACLQWYTTDFEHFNNQCTRICICFLIIFNHLNDFG